MDAFLKILGVVLAGVAAVMLLKENGFRIVSSICCVCFVGILAAELMAPILDMVTQLVKMTSVSEAVFAPVMKATAIGILAQIAGGICADAGEKTLERAVEFGCVLAVLYVSLPLFSAAADMLEKLMEG